jgi:ectoine hydroxylase-related dioxygenase (phytanoyl-CoA dioxygenase family)
MSDAMPIDPPVTRIDQHLARADGEFRRNGFVVRSDVLSVQELTQVRSEFLRFASGAMGSKKFAMFRDATGAAVGINRADDASELLFQMGRSRKIIDLVESVLGSAVVPLHTEFFCKPGRSAAGTPPHQDQIYYNSAFTDELAVAVWIALTDLDLSAAPLEYAQPPATRLLPHKRSRGAGFDYELQSAPTGPYVAVPVSQGDAVVHHAFVVHRSRPNLTPHPRLAVAFNYRTA